MGIFSRFRFRNSVEVDEGADVLLRSILSGTITVTREQAESIPSVASSVDLIGSMFAMTPFKLYRKVKQDGKMLIEEVEDSRVRLINSDPKDTLDGFQFKKALAADYLLGKGGYAYIDRKKNKIASLRYVRERAISVDANSDEIFKARMLRVSSSGEQYELWSFLKILRNTKDGASGRGLDTEISTALTTAYKTLAYQAKLIDVGGNKRGFLQSKHHLSKEAMAALKEAWNAMYSDNTSTAVVLNDGIEFKEASNNSVEMQINESRRTLNEEIEKVFHIKDTSLATYKEAVVPICEAFACALNRDLLLEKEKETMFFAPDYTEQLKVDIKDRYEAYRTAVGTGWLTLNEVRRTENKQDITGLDVIPLSLGNVLYDVKTGQYYTPNTGETKSLEEGGQNIEEE